MPDRLRLLSLLFFALLLVGCDTTTALEEPPPEPRVGRGATISTTLLAEKSAALINAEFAAFGLPAQARFGVAIHKIVYETIDAEGQMTPASAALVVPQTGGAQPLLMYGHGTVASRRNVPSAGSFEQIIGVIFASDGYVTVLPDLLGLGESPGRHPYVHAATSASATIDALRAAQDFAAANGITLNDELFLTGYSQGGYSAMAAHREIQMNHQGEFTVTAAAPMAGPYDLSGAMADAFLDRSPHPSPFYMPYALLAYNEIYGLVDDFSEMFTAPYHETLPPLFDGEHSSSQINAAMPDVALEILNPDYLAAFENDPNHPLRQHLRENDLYDWTPEAPIQLYHCGQDQHVPPVNTQVALASFQQRGASKVEFIDPMPEGTHTTCVLPSLTSAKLWFDSQATRPGPGV